MEEVERGVPILEVAVEGRRLRCRLCWGCCCWGVVGSAAAVVVVVACGECRASKKAPAVVMAIDGAGARLLLLLRLGSRRSEASVPLQHEHGSIDSFPFIIIVVVFINVRIVITPITINFCFQPCFNLTGNFVASILFFGWLCS